MAKQKNNLIFFAILLLLATVIFFGITITTALDRNRREIAALRRAVEAVPQSSGITANIAATTEKSPVIPCSNARFFKYPASRGGTLRTAIASDTGSLNPVTGNEATASSIIALCTSTLGIRNFENPEKFEPLMAESWQVSADGKKIYVKLRKNILWQDFVDPYTNKYVASETVTAHDFVFYVDVVRNMQVNAGALRSYFQDLESIRAISDLELEVVWKNEYYRSLEMTLGLIPLPRHFYCPDNAPFDPLKFNDDHKRNNMIVGCGAYKLTERVRDRKFVLERFENYFGSRLNIAPALEKRILEIVKADNTRLQMLLANDLDMLGLSAEQWNRRGSKKPFSKSVLTTGQKASDQPLQPGETLRRVKYLANAYFYIGYNLRNELFADRRVRQALTMLCNRDKILREVYHNQGRVISGPFFYNSPYYDKSIKPLPYDPAKALELLKSAGWQDSDGDGILDKNGKKFVFTALQVSGNPVQEKLLSIFKEDLARAGIDMKISPLEWPVYISKLDKRDYEVCSLGWQLPFESDPYQVWHSSQALNGSNHIGFANPAADRIIEEIRRTFDTAKRIELCHRFQKILHEEQPYTFLIVPETLQALSGRLENVQCFPLGLNSECFYIAR